MSYNPQNPNGQATSANSAPVVVASDQSTLSVNHAQMAGTATSTNNGTTDSGTQRVTIASDSTGQVKLAAGSNAIGAVDTELPAAAVLADGATNPTTPTVGADNSLWDNNGSAWNRQRSIAHAQNGTGVGIAASGMMAEFDDASPATVSENQFAPVRMSANRNLYGVIRDAAGNERGANVTSSNALVIDGSSTTQPVAGNVASGAADAGNPVKVAGRYNTSAPTLTDGQRGDLQLDASGNLKVAMATGGSSSVSINDGTTTASNLAGDTGQNAVMVAGARKEVTFTFAGAGNGTAYDVSNYRWVSVHVTANAGTINFEASNDGTNFVAVALVNAQTTAGSAGTNTNSSGAIFHGPLGYRYFRLRQASSTSSGIMEFFASPAAMQTIGVSGGTVSATQSGTWTVQPGNTANTTSWNMNAAPSTTGGWSVSSQTNLTSTATVSGAVAKFGGYMFMNLNSAPAYVQVFNLATSGAVTLGTTTPTFVVPIPANSTAANGAGANLELANGIAMSTGIQVAATTTPTGATTVTTGLTGFVLYK